MPTGDPVVPPAVEPFSLQEIRIAAVLNGGVSLAIWMSGVTLELEHLALASQGLGHWKPYRDVLNLLGATARVDVVAGTSAGGVNGAFLALGLTHQRDLALLRDLWTDSGSLEALLRPGDEKNPPSILQGDDYFLPQITAALTRTVSDLDNPRLGPASTDPLDLILTGTLWSGRETPFTDDMGVGITERDYDALFAFHRAGTAASSGNLDDASAVISQLASAARCTSSFPGAFEPHYVTSGGPGTNDRWASSAGAANFSSSQYVLDGGVLLNKPIRPALDAIYRQTGERQIRRVLAYVVPDPGEPPAPRHHGKSNEQPPAPGAGDVLLSVLTRLKSTDSVSAELAEIRDRNASVRARRKARSLVSGAMLQSANLPTSLWQGYLDERTSDAASTIATLMFAGQDLRRSRWSEPELAASLLRYARSQPRGFGFVPSGTLQQALALSPQDWSWGQTTVARLGDLTVDFLKRVLWFARLDDQVREQIVTCRRDVARVLASIRADQLDLARYWTGTAQSSDAIPTREGGSNQSTTNLAELDAWVARVVPAWDNALPAEDGAQTAAAVRHATLYAQAHQLAEILTARRADILAIIADPNPAMVEDGRELDELTGFASWMLAPTDPDELLSRMLQLDVVQVATSGATTQAEQEVELVQVSCSNRDEITGMQLHHFGAFYRAPWRVNDWIEGRLDGSRQIMRFLLSPQRLRQRGFTNDELCGYLRALAVPTGSPHADYLAARWDAQSQHYSEEVARILSGTSSASALDLIAEALAMPLRLQALAEDLPALARAILKEGHDASPASGAWLRMYDQAVAAEPDRVLSAKALWALRQEMPAIGRQQIADDVGSDTFARTVSHATTVAAATFTAPPKLRTLRLVSFSSSALRGYTALVWTMVSFLTRGSAFGTRLFELVVAVGGAMIALSLLVPGLPAAVPLAGLLVLGSGITAGALRTPKGRWFGLRLAVALVLAASLEGSFIWRDIDKHGWGDSDTARTLVNVAVGASIVLLGGYVARARPSKKEAVATVVLLIAVLGLDGWLIWQAA